MSSGTLWDHRLTMLLACASPGSALAYHRGLTTSEGGMLRRDKATDGRPAPRAHAARAAADVLDLINSGRVIALP